MTEKLDGLMDQYDHGQLNRRQLITALAAVVTSGTLLGKTEKAQAAEATFAPAMSLNHVHLYVADIDRSVEYYSQVIGAKYKDSPGPNNKTLYLPGAHEGSGSWMSITKADATKPVGINHVGYGVKVPQDQYPAIADKLTKRFPKIKPPRPFISKAAGQELYFTDPDGISVQIIQIEHNGEQSGFDEKTGKKLKTWKFDEVGVPERKAS
jgi:catechol 2,3-dioxygenase-like lactoylglutathione lyase family enzyme